MRNWDARVAVATAILLLVVGACGGGASTEPESPDDGSTLPANTTSDSSPGPSDSSADEELPPEASVTIGDETYTFSHEGFAASSNCRPSDNGTFQALLLLVSDSGELTPRSDLTLVLLHDPGDTSSAESNSIRLRLGHLDDGGLDYTPGWFADADFAESVGLPSGVSQVDSYTIEGNTVSGTATFTSGESDAAYARGEIDTVTPAQGSFSVTCGG